MPSPHGHRLVLASASPARLATLRAAGLDPEVVVSDVDESLVTGLPPAELALELARRKGEAVFERLTAPEPVEGLIVVGCDSVLELAGEVHGKPHDPRTATARWRAMRGRSGVLHTGHHLRIGDATRTRGARTVVHFADLSDAEIDAYVATGEPLVVAGGFTIDGLGGAFVTGIEGDHHNVVGISLPLLRVLLAELGVAWTDLWTGRA
jgi:septum formation protein